MHSPVVWVGGMEGWRPPSEPAISAGWILWARSLHLHFQGHFFLLQQLSGNCEFQTAVVTWL